jgi:hypothetical protein
MRHRVLAALSVSSPLFEDKHTVRLVASTRPAAMESHTVAKLDHRIADTDGDSVNACDTRPVCILH